MSDSETTCPICGGSDLTYMFDMSREYVVCQDCGLRVEHEGWFRLCARVADILSGTGKEKKGSTPADQNRLLLDLWAAINKYAATPYDDPKLYNDGIAPHMVAASAVQRALDAAITAAVRAEREACAEECDEIAATHDRIAADESQSEYVRRSSSDAARGARSAAAAIRARGES